LFQNVSNGLFVEPDNFSGLGATTTGLGPGDEIFMIGRFISHDGRKKNHPSTRFGNLSMVVAPIKHPDGGEEESFAVDMRSISGYSGSPVFIYWQFGGGHLSGINRTFDKSFLGLLGVDWGHIPMRLPAIDDKTGEPLPEKSYVKSHTSMAGVVPAWRLRELLNGRRFKEQRMQDENDEAKRIANDPTIAEADFASSEPSPPANDANPNHREDFTSLANAAARKQKPAE
jgi:hypothetical protein